MTHMLDASAVILELSHSLAGHCSSVHCFVPSHFWGDIMTHRQALRVNDGQVRLGICQVYEAPGLQGNVIHVAYDTKDTAVVEWGGQ